ncbi:MAG: CoA-binding protein [Dehalococcoidia bacterium]|nr:CoA-binding protein [Dehalococcoidia bacterium]
MTHPLHRVFYPRSVAIIGASADESKLGFLCVRHMLQWVYAGNIYPINPGTKEILGLKTYPSLADIPEPEVDLAILVRPSAVSVDAMRECAAKKVKGVVMISSGFRELGTEAGQQRQCELAEAASGGGIKIIGPNTIGMICRSSGINCSFQDTLKELKPGNISIVAQSGGTCMFIVHALMNRDVGVSKALSLGNQCNLGFAEMLEYFEEDEDTKVVILHIEGMENAEETLRAGASLARKKPVLCYKVGRYDRLAQPIKSHTGAIAGSYDAHMAAFRKAGFLIMDSIEDMVDSAKALAMQPPAAGPRFAALSPQSGPAIIIADTCRQRGLTLAEFSPEGREKLHAVVDPTTYKDNPVDMAITATRFKDSVETLKTVLEDPNVDLVICSTLYHFIYNQLLQAAIHLAPGAKKPLVVCCDRPKGITVPEAPALEAVGVPVYDLPERAAVAAAALVNYGRVRKGQR